MNYKINDITERAAESPLWKKLENQSGEVLPYLLERFLLLGNWRVERKYVDQYEDTQIDTSEEISYLNLLLADAITVLLNQEARIRKLEELKK